MSTEIDEDKIILLIERTGKKALKLKEEYHDLVLLLNQLRGICKDSNGKLPMSGLTKKELKKEFREHIYQECLEAAERLNLG